jgi:hypothetical protein
MKENRERIDILPYNIEYLITIESASGRPFAEPLAVPKWHSIAITAEESVSFTGLSQKGTVRLMLAAPDRQLALLKGRDLCRTATKRLENRLSTRRDEQARRSAGTIR